MDVLVAALCDAAVDYGGKLVVLGAFDTVVAARLPAIQPQCAVALRIVFRRGEEGAHGILVNFVDADGRSVIPPLETVWEVELGEDADFVTRNLVLNIHGMAFGLAGAHAVDVSVGGRPVASIPLQVKVVPSPPGEAGPDKPTQEAG
jgi:hypothetical protein